MRQTLGLAGAFERKGTAPVYEPRKEREVGKETWEQLGRCYESKGLMVDFGCECW